MSLTEESVEGAVSERGVSVTVPGGVVKYENQADDEILYTSELVDYGNDAQTLLESY